MSATAAGSIVYASIAHAGGPVAPDELWAAWSPDPWTALALAAGLALYEGGVRRLRPRSREGRPGPLRVWCFRGATLALAAALLSPVETLAGTLFSAHMVQHLLLVLVAAPLFVLARPLAALVWGLPAGARRSIGRSRTWRLAAHAGGALASPVPAWLLAGGALWAWHAPVLYEAALAHPALHGLEHLTLLGTAGLFWWVAVGPGRRETIGRGGAVFFVFTTALHTGFLGGLLTFSGVPWYEAHAAASWGLTPLEDQQLAGLLMWVPMGAVYAGAALHALVTWLRDLEGETAGPAATVLVMGALLAGCGSDRPSTSPSRSVAGGDAEVGRELVRSYACGACHDIDGMRDARGVVGPPLTGFARRKMIAGTVPNRTDHLIRWLQDPPSIEPGTAMPDLGLSAMQARHVAAYLYTLE